MLHTAVILDLAAAAAWGRVVTWLLQRLAPPCEAMKACFLYVTRKAAESIGSVSAVFNALCAFTLAHMQNGHVCPPRCASTI
jgi:hypothetical protein